MLLADILKEYVQVLSPNNIRMQTTWASQLAERMGGEFITHKYIPDEYDEAGYYGGVAFKDSLLLLPTSSCETGLKIIVRDDDYKCVEWSRV
jgi:hypothetical protein